LAAITLPGDLVFAWNCPAVVVLADRQRVPRLSTDRLGREGTCLSCLLPFFQLDASGEELAAPHTFVFRSGTLVRHRRE
jgi:hypothetical protein